jgi:hypothetical protein
MTLSVVMAAMVAMLGFATATWLVAKILLLDFATAITKKSSVAEVSIAVGISAIPICPGQLINNWPQGPSSRVQRVKTIHVVKPSSWTNYVCSAREE